MRSPLFHPLSALAEVVGQWIVRAWCALDLVKRRRTVSCSMSMSAVVRREISSGAAPVASWMRVRKAMSSRRSG